MTTNKGLGSEAIRRLVLSQRGVLTSAQAAANGIAHETLRTRVQRGIWQRPLPGVFVLQTGPPSRTQWGIAALLYAGDDAMLSGSAALRAFGLWPEGRAGPEAPQHANRTMTVLVPHPRRRQSIEPVRIVRTTRLPEAVTRRGLRLAPPARALVDACRSELGQQDVAGARALVTAVLSKGDVSPYDVERELRRAPRNRSSNLRFVLAAVMVETRAAAARRFLDGLGRIGPFGAIRNVTVFAGTRRVAQAEALWPERAVAAAVGAPKNHVSKLTDLGFAVVEVEPQRVEEDLPAELRKIAAVLRSRPEATIPPGVALLPEAKATQEA